jgi:hypothetical protein
VLRSELGEADRRLHQALTARAVEPTPTPEARAHAIADLEVIAGHRREPIERARAEFLCRLVRRSDDFGATQGLRLTEAVLDRLARPEGLWAWQARGRGRRRER